VGRSLPENTTNVISGSVTGPVVQARVIEGGVHIHATPPITTPRQLPPAPGHFAARQQELAKLDMFVTQARSCQRPNVVALTGPGGAGKTAMALHWLHRNLDLFPDGQLYADLDTFGSNGPSTPSIVLSGFLRALGVPAQDVPLELSELTALFRSLTADKAIVVLADDAESVAQVRPLVPTSARSTLLTTSRRRLGALSLDGARFVPVDVLDEPAAVELISQVIGALKVDAEPEPTRALVRLCDGLPIALRIAAARLSTRPGWSIARIVATLADEHRRLASLAVAGTTSLQASLDLSYEELQHDVARLYRFLGLHPSTEFDLRAAAVLVDLHPMDTEELTEVLVDVSLIDEVSDHRFRFHDLVRLHARHRSEHDDDTADRDAAEQRLITWYLDTAIAADLVVMPHRRRVCDRYDTIRNEPPAYLTAAAALDWLEAELPNLLGVQRRAADRGWWQPAWQLCEAMWSLFLYRKHFEHWVPSHELGVDAARRCGDREAHARLAVQLGFAFLNRHRYEQATDHFADALAVSRAAGDLQGEATALEHLGLAARGADRHQDAMSSFVQALEITEGLGEHRGSALHLRRIGETLGDIGRNDEATEYLQRAVEAATDIGDRVLRARALTRLGSAQARLSQLTEARGHLDESVRILQDSGSAQYHAEALEAMAELHLRTGEHALAYDDLALALSLYCESGLPQAEHVQERLAELGMPCPPLPRDAVSKE
jgi:tetratricopeptide (TPR) repeat protein